MRLNALDRDKLNAAEEERRRLSARALGVEEELQRMKESNLPDLARLNTQMQQLEEQLRGIASARSKEEEEKEEKKEKRKTAKKKRGSVTARQSAEKPKTKTTAKPKLAKSRAISKRA